MKVLQAIGSGLAGAAVLTLLHEVTRRTVPDAPRMDRLGMQAIAKSLQKFDQEVPDRQQLFNITMLGDLAANSLYYSLVGLGEDRERVWIAGSILGLAAGVGAVVLPSSLGLDSSPSRRTPTTQWMTVLLYLSGGIAAAAAHQILEKVTGE